MKILPKTKFDYFRIFALLAIAFYLFVYPILGLVDYEPKEGDIIFQSLPPSKLTYIIEDATNSKYSHVGIIFKKDNSWYAREAMAPVKDTKLFAWIMRGRGGNFAVYRFKDEYQKHIPQIIEATKKYLGRDYDIFYKFDDELIYCSELIFKAFKEVTTDIPEKMKNFFKEYLNEGILVSFSFWLHLIFFFNP